LDSSTDLDLEQDDLLDTGSINSEMIQERLFEAEMERYDFVMARARAIVERRRQEELEDNDMPIGEDNDGNSDVGSEWSGIASS
jgi:hypothetical protein